MIYQANSAASKVYHYAVALVRKDSGSTSMGFVVALIETIFAFALAMSIMMLMRGVGAKIRGEFGFFILTGISLFLLHNKLIKSIMGMKKTDSMLPVLSISRGMMICGGIIHAIYMQFMVTAILYFACAVYYKTNPVQDWAGVIYVVMIVIMWSIALGLFFLSVEPLAPKIVNRAAAIYRRLGMVTSGKMIPGNLMAMTGRFHGMFIINPLFHSIDQLRGFTFQHYNPFVSSLTYPLHATWILLSVSALVYFGVQKYR